MRLFARATGIGIFIATIGGVFAMWLDRGLQPDVIVGFVWGVLTWFWAVLIATVTLPWIALPFLMSIPLACYFVYRTLTALPTSKVLYTQDYIDGIVWEIDQYQARVFPLCPRCRAELDFVAERLHTPYDVSTLIVCHRCSFHRPVEKAPELIEKAAILEVQRKLRTGEYVDAIKMMRKQGSKSFIDETEAKAE